MPELVFLLVKVGFLVLLWVFVLSAVFAVRADLFGTRARVTRAERRRDARAARPAPAPAPARQRRSAPRGPSRLVVVDGPLAGMAIPLGGSPITVGRAEDSTLVLSDDFASTRHARFVPSAGGWYVEDLGSTNGTYLDRTKVLGPTPVPAGMPVRIGKTVLELRP